MNDPDRLPKHVQENRSYWNGMAHEWVPRGERAWALHEPTWGIWGVPESELQMLPEDMTGMRAVDLGCGTGYVCAWMARRGATVTGIDASEKQLQTARRLAREHDVELTLIHGNAEATPFEDASLDFVFSEYGAAIWCDPFAWIPEAHRILKAGGRLVFLGHHPLTTVCSPWDGSSPLVDSMIRPYFGMRGTDWSEVPVDPGGVEFNMPLSDWFSLFRRTGLQVEDYREPRPAADVHSVAFTVSADWARRWPSEQVWKLRKVDPA